jgi:sensory rhodopsin
MVDAVTIAYGLSTVGLLAGVGIVWQLLADETVGTDDGAFQYLMIIPGFAALSYLVMAAGIGRVTVAGNAILLPRYIDWLVTTPVLVGYVGYTAGAPRKWILGVAGADALMIAFGGVATVLDPPLKWLFFALSGGCHIALFVVLYRVFPKYVSAGTQREGLFRLLQNHIGLLWSAYPCVWIASVAGIGAVSTLGVALVVAYLDVVAKTPYVYFIWMRRQAFNDTAETGDTATATGSGDGTDAGTPA